MFWYKKDVEFISFKIKPDDALMNDKYSIAWLKFNNVVNNFALQYILISLSS